MTQLKNVYAILSWGIVALGAVHMLATLRLHHTLNSSSLWFFSGGIALALTGTLNLLHRVYGRIALGLRRVCIGTNILMTIFGVLGRRLSRQYCWVHACARFNWWCDCPVAESAGASSASRIHPLSATRDPADWSSGVQPGAADKANAEDQAHTDSS